MAITSAASSKEARAFSLGPIKCQILDVSAVGASTSGTLTADQLQEIFQVILPAGLYHTAAPTFSGNVATLAFASVTPAKVAASKVVQDITYTAATAGSAGNSITIAYTAGGTAGSEVVSVTGSAISIQIETGVSTATQVKAAFDAAAPATTLASASITGTAGTAQVTATAAAFTGGSNAGITGSCLCFGR